VDEPAENVTAEDLSPSAGERSWLRRREFEAAMRSSPVVVLDVVGKDFLQVTPGEHKQVVETVLSYGAHPALGERVRVRGAHGGEDGLGVDRGEHVVEASGELAVAVSDEEAHPPAGFLELDTQVACHLGHPQAVRVRGDAEEVDDAAFHFDHEEHVVATEEDGVDGEEVGCHDAVGLGTEELGPGRTGSPWRWGNPMASQDVCDAALGDPDAELLQLSCDTQVAPARVLPRQAED